MDSLLQHIIPSSSAKLFKGFSRAQTLFLLSLSPPAILPEINIFSPCFCPITNPFSWPQFEKLRFKLNVVTADEFDGGYKDEFGKHLIPSHLCANTYPYYNVSHSIRSNIV